MYEMAPLMSGDTAQPTVIRPTVCQSTRLAPNATQPKPTTAPTIECVVDTGKPKYDASISQVPAASKAEIMPQAKINAGYASPKLAQASGCVPLV